MKSSMSSQKNVHVVVSGENIDAVLDGEVCHSGSDSGNLKEFSEIESGNERATIESDDPIRQVHNCFARNDPFTLEEARNDSSNDSGLLSF